MESQQTKQATKPAKPTQTDLKQNKDMSSTSGKPEENEYLADLLTRRKMLENLPGKINL
jgi:hypothetical protein